MGSGNGSRRGTQERKNISVRPAIRIVISHTYVSPQQEEHAVKTQ
jgi:hypothetical protein